MSTYSNVYATFEISAEYLQTSKLPECLDALSLLHTLAFMHSSEVTEILFQKASNYATELHNIRSIGCDKRFLSVRHIVRLSEYIQRGWSSNFQDRLRWRKACAILESLSLIPMQKHITERMHYSTFQLYAESASAPEVTPHARHIPANRFQDPAAGVPHLQAILAEGRHIGGH